MSPQKLREILFHLIYSFEFASNQRKDSRVFLMQHHKTSKKNICIAERLFHSVQEYFSQIDQMIAQKAIGYKLSSIPRVERTALRLGIYELCFSKEGIPPKVAISEAIRLVRKFATAESGKFVNGILDVIYKDMFP